MNDTLSIRSALKIPEEFGIYRGFFSTRQKNKKGIPFPGHEPHFLGEGVPRVRYGMDNEPMDDQGNSEFGAAVETEFKFAENRRSWSPTYFASHMMLVQVTFGTARVMATSPELRCLREVGEVLRHLESSRVPILMVADTWIGTLKGPVPGGRLVPAAILDLKGVPLWIHPLAIKEGVIAAAFPESQKVRDLTPPPPQAAKQVSSADEPEWYGPLAGAFQAAGFEGDALRDEVFRARARGLLAQGKVKNEKDGVAAARREYGEAKAQAASRPAAASVAEATKSQGQDEASSVSASLLKRGKRGG